MIVKVETAISLSQKEGQAVNKRTSSPLREPGRRKRRNPVLLDNASIQLSNPSCLFIFTGKDAFLEDQKGKNGTGNAGWSFSLC